MDSNEPTSPCIKRCVLDTQTNLCAGCHRTLEEIAAWSDYTAAEKRAVLEAVGRRASAAAANRNGR